MQKKVWNWISVPMFIMTIVMIWKGYDKMMNYYSSETLGSLNKNAYVGGDAYNYIINGNYATAFFVLATLFTIAGFSCIALGYLKQSNYMKEQIIKEQQKLNKGIVTDKNSNQD